MLECPLDLLYGEGRSPDIHFWVLRVLDREPKASFLVLAVGPAALLLAKVGALLSDGDADALVIEYRAVELEELDEVAPQVNPVRAAPLVVPLEVARDQHRQ